MVQYLIHDHDNVVLITVLPDGGQEVGGWRHKAPLPQDGLYDDGCRVLRSCLHLQHPFEGVMRAAAAAPRLILIKGGDAG